MSDTPTPFRTMKKDTPSDSEDGMGLPHVMLDDIQGLRCTSTNQSRRVLALAPHHLRWICIALHVLLVLLHIVLFVVWGYHKEHRLVVPLSSSGLTSTIVVVILQVYITVYTVTLVVSTQQLSLRRTLLKHQPLTATHDEASAWTGLGAALLSLWRQTSIAASVFGTFSITLYLACITILHVTTPSLFNMQAFNNTAAGQTSTTIGMPNMTVVEPPNVPGDRTSTPFRFWADTAALLPYLGRATPDNTLGVYNSSVFDVLKDTSGVGNATVGATGFNVTCGFLPNITVLGSIPAQPNATNPTTFWTASYITSAYNMTFQVGIISNFVLRQVVYNKINGNPPLARNMIFYLAYNIEDSSGNHGSLVVPNPPMNQVDVHGIVPNSSTNFVQMVGCTLSLVQQVAIVDAQTNQLLALEPDVVKTSSTWRPWEPELQSQDNYWSWVKDPQVDAWGDMFDQMPAGTVSVGNYCTTSPTGVCSELTIGEEYLMGRLGLYPQISPFVAGPTTPPLLHDFENALASMAASLYWAAGNIGPDRFGRAGAITSPLGKAVLLTGATSMAVTASRLNLNIIPIVVGLGTSLILLILATILIPVPKGFDAVVNTVGILQLVWITHKRPTIREKIGRVEDPTVDNLREAGMFDVRVAGEKLEDNSYELLER